MISAAAADQPPVTLASPAKILVIRHRRERQWSGVILVRLQPDEIMATQEIFCRIW